MGNLSEGAASFVYMCFDSHSEDEYRARRVYQHSPNEDWFCVECRILGYEHMSDNPCLLLH